MDFTLIGDVTKSAPGIAPLIELRFESQSCGCQSPYSFYFLLCMGFESIATVPNTRRRQSLEIARQIERSQSRAGDLNLYKFHFTCQILFRASQSVEN